MRTIISALIILLFCKMANAQSGLPITLENLEMDSHLENREPATITIQLKHLPDSVKKVSVKYSLLTFGSRMEIIKYYTTNSDGLVKIKLGQNLPYQQLWLTVGDYLYTGIYVNSDLKITIDVSKIKNKEDVYLSGNSINFSGLDGELNTVMNEHAQFKQEKRRELSNRLRELCQSRIKYNVELFSRRTDSIWRALSDLNNEFIQEYPKYGWAINNEAASDFYSMLCLSYWGDTMPETLFTKINDHQPYFTSVRTVFYYNYLSTYLIMGKHGIQNKIDKIDSLFPCRKADILKTFLLREGKSSFASTFPVILKSMNTGWCKRLVESEINEASINLKKIDSLLAIGEKTKGSDNYIGIPVEQLTFDARLYKLDSIENVDDFIVNLKSRFKGKALIIDFWATWCVPCLEDMPFSKKLHEANEDLPVEYIYICTDIESNINDWKNKITELQLSGTHVYMDEKIIEELKKSFITANSGYPTYVVVGANGKLRLEAIHSFQFLDRDKLKSAIGL